MTIKNLLKDYGASQHHIMRAFDVTKGTVSIWTNKSIPIYKYRIVKTYLLDKATEFVNKYE